MLKVCAVRKDQIYLEFSFLKIYRKSVSSPIQINASENSKPLEPLFAIRDNSFPVSASNTKLKTNDAIRNPRTNLGNLSQRIVPVGLISEFVPLYDQ